MWGESLACRAYCTLGHQGVTDSSAKQPSSNWKGSPTIPGLLSMIDATAFGHQLAAKSFSTIVLS